MQKPLPLPLDVSLRCRLHGPHTFVTPDLFISKLDKAPTTPPTPPTVHPRHRRFKDCGACRAMTSETDHDSDLPRMFGLVATLPYHQETTPHTFVTPDLFISKLDKAPTTPPTPPTRTDTGIAASPRRVPVAASPTLALSLRCRLHGPRHVWRWMDTEICQDLSGSSPHLDDGL